MLAMIHESLLRGNNKGCAVRNSIRAVGWVATENAEE